MQRKLSTCRESRVMVLGFIRVYFEESSSMNI